MIIPVRILNGLGRAIQAAYLVNNDPKLLRKALSAHQEAVDIAADMAHFLLSYRFFINVGVVFRGSSKVKKMQKI